MHENFTYRFYAFEKQKLVTHIIHVHQYSRIYPDQIRWKNARIKCKKI